MRRTIAAYFIALYHHNRWKGAVHALCAAAAGREQAETDARTRPVWFSRALMALFFHFF